MTQSEDRNPTDIYRRWVMMWFAAAVGYHDPDTTPRWRRWMQVPILISFLSFALFMLIAPTSIRWWVVFAEHTDSTWNIARNMPGFVRITRPV